MPSPRKTFDKADLLTFLTETDDEAEVGSFVVIRPSPTLFGQSESRTHEVQAITEAYWCERYQLALVVQRARIVDSGDQALPPHHPLVVAHRSSKREPRVNMRYGGTSSQLVRWAAELADAYRDEIASIIPSLPVDLTSDAPIITVGEVTIQQFFGDRANDGFVDGWKSGTLHFVPGPTPIPEPEPEPTVPTVDDTDDDSTPTGTTIDDVFAEHDSDDGEVQP